jgi:hypothetical protein
LNFFQRQFGEFFDAPNLPSNDTVEAGTTTTFRNAISGAISYTAHRARCEDLHNLVHRYCGGNMLRMTSPNDPIFFLHHASIDRMWSIWQKKVAAGTSLYVQSSATLGHKLNDAMLFNEPGDRAIPDQRHPAQMIDTMRCALQRLVRNDVPRSAPNPSLPGHSEDSTYKAVRFRIKGAARASITGSTGAGLTSMNRVRRHAGGRRRLFYGYVWVQLIAPAGGREQRGHYSRVPRHDEGYYAATGRGEFALGDKSR